MERKKKCNEFLPIFLCFVVWFPLCAEGSNAKAVLNVETTEFIPENKPKAQFRQHLVGGKNSPRTVVANFFFGASVVKGCKQPAIRHCQGHLQGDARAADGRIRQANGLLPAVHASGRTLVEYPLLKM
jgi:hypothetical protein